MDLIARILRKTALPALLVAFAVASPLATPASAQDMPSTMTENGMNTTMVMVPMGSEMVQVTVHMPMSMSTTPTFTQPQIRLIPGVGYEIDYGGPSVRIERFAQN